MLLKKASIDMSGAVCGYVSGQETSIRKALGSPLSPIWVKIKKIINQQFLVTDNGLQCQYASLSFLSEYPNTLR